MKLKNPKKLKKITILRKDESMLEFLLIFFVVTMLWTLFSLIEKVSVTVIWREEVTQNDSLLKRMIGSRTKTEKWTFERCKIKV